MVEELRAGRVALLALLPAGEHLREAEHFFSPRGTLEAVQDLKDTLFRGAARKLMGVSYCRSDSGSSACGDASGSSSGRGSWP